MSAIFRARFMVWAMMFSLVVLLGSCGSDSTTDEEGNGTRPSITSLSLNSAVAGDQVLVRGVNFGTTQGTSSIQLNGVDFTVNEWTDTKLDVSVTAGMTSGIVVAKRDGMVSQSGAEAQLFIGAAPSGPPVISSINPDAHPRGSADPVTLTGQNFGTVQGTSVVLFTAQTAVSQTGFVEANVATRDIGGVEVPTWSTNAIDVYVPATAASGDCYIVVGGVASNKVYFESLAGGSDYDPSITLVTPNSGAPGDSITITGDQFGDSQGGSTIDINGTQVVIFSWSMTEIVCFIPEGATSGFLTIHVTGNSDWVDFIVADRPIIGGVTPPDLRINQKVTITGEFFGVDQGSGTLKIENQTIPVDLWQNDKIEVNQLPPISPADREAVPVTVTNDAGLISEAVMVKLTSDLTASVSVSPRAGKANSPDGSGGFIDDGTEFSFFVDVTGGSDNYSYALLENWENLTTIQPTTTTSPVLHRFDVLGDYHTGVQVTDTETNDVIVIEGPILRVVDFDEPVITTMGIAQFDNGGLDGPNNLSYYPDDDSEPRYYDLTIDQNADLFFTSDLTDVMVAGTPSKGEKRNLSNFFVDGSDPRPLGYRYADGFGSRVGIKGFNFGATKGTLCLRSEGPDDDLDYEMNASDIITWEDEYIEFRLPADVDEDLSGNVLVIPTTTEKTYLSDDPLICSPLFNVVGPTTIDLTSTITITGRDLLPPVSSGLTGAKTYMIWWVNATYMDEFQTQTVDGKVCAVIPVEVNAGSTTFDFDMANLTGTRTIEYFNGKVEGRLANGTLNNPSDPPAAEYSFFLWTGAMDPDTVSLKDFARSGVFSQGWNVPIGGGGGGTNDPPTAVIAASETSGPPTLNVTFTFTGSFDTDGTITKYEFNDGDGSGWIDLGGVPTPQVVAYDTEGTYSAMVRVTDDDLAQDTDTVVITVGDPPEMFNLDVVAAELSQDGQGMGQPLLVKPWLDGAAFLSFDVVHDTLGFIGTVVCNNLASTSDGDVNFGTIMVPAGSIHINPNSPPIKRWIKPNQALPDPWSKFIFDDATLANGNHFYVVDEGDFLENP